MGIEIVEYFVNCHFLFSRSHDLDTWLSSKKGSISISILVTCIVTFFFESNIVHLRVQNPGLTTFTACLVCESVSLKASALSLIHQHN